LKTVVALSSWIQARIMEVEKKTEEWKTIDRVGKRKRKASSTAATENTLVLEQPDDVEDMDVADETTTQHQQEDMPYAKPSFGKAKITSKMKKELRRIPVPPQRLTPLRNHWKELLNPLVEHMQLQVRMNTKRRCVEMRISQHTEDPGALQKGADFMRAFMLGFEVQDAIALLRLNDLFLDSFEIKDVKRLQGNHLARAIGRIAGQQGKTKNAIENSTRTRIVLADSKIHIMGSFANAKSARNAICSLIMGSEPGKVYNRLKTVSRRLSERL